MFDKVSRSWHLVKASAGVLRDDKELLLFPVVSSVATLLVAATFLLPILGLGLFDGRGVGVVEMAVMFAFYLCQYTVIFFFNTALVGAAMIRLGGGDPSLGDGLRIARGKLGAIVGYAALAATVGLVLKFIGERGGALQRIAANLLGMAWTFATFLVVPVLVSRDIGPVDAVRESVSLLKRTWGENVVGNVGINLAFGLVTTLVVVLAIGATVAAAFAGGPKLAIPVAVLGGIAVAFVAVVQAALSGIYAAAVYRYAVDGQAPAGFAGGELATAFRAR